MFYFHFGGRKYSVMLITVRGPTSLIILNKEIDSLVLNYLIFYKVIQRLVYDYSKKVEIKDD